MEYIIIALICFSPLIGAFIYYQIKVRSYFVYISDSDCPDQIYKYYKVNLYTKKRKRIYRDEYWLKVAENFDNESKFDNLMEENPFSLLH